MANPEHLKVIEHGVDFWNNWRKEKWYQGANLIDIFLRERGQVRVDLTGVSLVRVNLSGIDLVDADLSHSDLRGANLTGSHLSGAILSSVDLSGARLGHADFTNANLAEADLSYTDISSTFFSGANLSGANLKGASMFRTVFGDTRLAKTKHLESCIHQGPSIIDHRTLVQSGDLPLAFLRGCGLPDSIIEYYPSLLNQFPIQFYSCFISYSHKDEEFAQRLYTDLQEDGVRCWFAPEDLQIGAKIRSTIDETIRVHDKLLLILSEHSVNSSWVEHEVETAFDKETERGHTTLFPIRLDDTVMNIKIGWAAKIKRERYIGDFCKWRNYNFYKDAFERLLRDLKTDNKKIT